MTNYEQIRIEGYCFHSGERMLEDSLLRLHFLVYYYWRDYWREPHITFRIIIRGVI